MKWLLVIGLYLCMVLFAAPASATSMHTNLTVSPAINEWILAPGQSQKKEILVINTTKEFLPIQSLIEGALVTEAIDESKKERFDASQWFQVSDPSFILRPQQARKVRITVSVPPNAEPGGHYATVYFRQLSPADFRAQTHVVPSVGMIGFVTVKGKIDKWLRPERVTAEVVAEGVELKASLRNVGNVHTFATGAFVVKDLQGREVLRTPLRANFILPGTERVFTSRTSSLSPGVYTIELHSSLGSQKLPTLTATFWTLPIKELILTLAVAVLVWFCGFRLRHRWRRAFHALSAKNEL